MTEWLDWIDDNNNHLFWKRGELAPGILAQTTLPIPVGQNDVQNGALISTIYDRDNIEQAARDTGQTWGEVFSSTAIHEIGHIRLGRAAATHPDLADPDFWDDTVLGQSQEDIYEDIFQDPEGMANDARGVPNGAQVPACINSVLSTESNFHNAVRSARTLKVMNPTYNLDYVPYAAP